MPQLILSKSEVKSVFELLGENEDNLSYSVAWLLLKSETMLSLILNKLFGKIKFDIVNTSIYLQKTDGTNGRTDIELSDYENFYIIIEAKKGWVLPSYDQLDKYSRRESFNKNENIPHKAIVTLTECSTEYVDIYFKHQQINNTDIKHISWKEIYFFAKQASITRNHKEKKWIAELNQYLGGIMTMQNIDSNLVYVVSLSKDIIENSSLTWIEVVTKKNKYFHPIGKGFPKNPPNYIAFRYDGMLQSIHFIESYKVIKNFHEEIEELPDTIVNPHFIYTLGKAIVPNKLVRTGNIKQARRVSCYFDTLLTSNTISEAEDITKERMMKYNI